MSTNKEEQPGNDQAGDENEQEHEVGGSSASPDAASESEPQADVGDEGAPNGADWHPEESVEADQAGSDGAQPYTDETSEGATGDDHPIALVPGPVADEDDGGPRDEEEDPDAGQPFSAARAIDGEFLLPQSDLVEWEHHPRRGSRLIGAHFSALALSAADPASLRPIVVIRKSDGKYAVVNGRFLLHAVRMAHPGNRNVQVRCVLFTGTEAEAVASVCDQGLGVVGLHEMEKARILLSLQQTSGVSQTAIAERYPRLTVTKVNNMLRAARVWADHPVLFKVLQEPDRVAIDYGVKLFTGIRRMSADELRGLIERAQDLEANGERFQAVDALDVLRLPRGSREEQRSDRPETERQRSHEQDEPGGGEGQPLFDDSFAPGVEHSDEEILTESVFGHDDQPVGTAEELEGGSERLTLPTAIAVAAMSMGEREEAASAFILRVRRHFGLGQQD